MKSEEVIKLIDKNGLSEAEKLLHQIGYSYKEIREMLDSVKEHYSHSDNDWIYCAGHLKCYESEKERYRKEIDKRISKKNMVKNLGH